MQNKKYFLLAFSLIVIIAIIILSNYALTPLLRVYSDASPALSKPVASSSISLVIPSHISLLDFYNTYGERLLGNSKSGIKIISREEWGADPQYANPQYINKLCKRVYCSPNSYSAESNLDFVDYWRWQQMLLNYRKNFQDYDNAFLKTKTKSNGITYQYLPVEQIIIHHTAGKFTTSLKESEKEVRRIYFEHAVQRRWGDIGYHYLIDGAGHIFEGTLGGKYSIGAHTFFHNRATIGIALMGDFRPGHDKITPAMAQSLGKLVKYIAQQYHWNLDKKIFYLRKKDYLGREWTNKIVKGHNEVDYRVKKTECPGVSDDYLRSIIYPYLFSNEE